MRRGLPPESVVPVTGIPVAPAVEEVRARGVLDRHPMFSEIIEDGVPWPDGTTLRARERYPIENPSMILVTNGSVEPSGHAVAKVHGIVRSKLHESASA